MARSRRRRRRYRKNPSLGTLALLGGGAVAVYFLVIRPRQQAAAYTGGPGYAAPDWRTSVLDALTMWGDKRAADKAGSTALRAVTPSQRYTLVQAGSSKRCYDNTTRAFVAERYCGVAPPPPPGMRPITGGTPGTLTPRYSDPLEGWW